MAAGTQDFNADYWIGMITANPVLLVAFCTVFRSGRDVLVGWTNSARWLWLALLRGWFSGIVIILAGLFGPALGTLIAADALYEGQVDRMTARNALWFLAAALIALVLVVIATAGAPGPQAVPLEGSPSWWPRGDPSAATYANTPSRGVDVATSEPVTAGASRDTAGLHPVLVSAAIVVTAYVLGRTRSRRR